MQINPVNAAGVVAISQGSVSTLCAVVAMLDRRSGAKCDVIVVCALMAMIGQCKGQLFAQIEKRSISIDCSINK